MALTNRRGWFRYLNLFLLNNVSISRLFCNYFCDFIEFHFFLFTCEILLAFISVVNIILLTVIFKETLYVSQSHQRRTAGRDP